MDDAFQHFQAAREMTLSASERGEVRASLIEFSRALPIGAADPVAAALRELQDIALPIIDKLEVRASLRASILPAEAPLAPTYVRAETGFVSMFSSMLTHRTPAFA